MLRNFVLAAALLLLAGCAGGSRLGYAPTSLDEVNFELKSRKATITLRNGEEREAWSVRVDAHWTAYYPEIPYPDKPVDEQEISTDQIKHIAVSGGNRAGRGFLIGMIPGVLLLAPGLFEDTSDAHPGTGGIYVLAYAGLGGVILIGGIIGALEGATYKKEPRIVYRAPVDQFLPAPSPR